LASESFAKRETSKGGGIVGSSLLRLITLNDTARNRVVPWSPLALEHTCEWLA
jgi:hypothetical protein